MYVLIAAAATAVLILVASAVVAVVCYKTITEPEVENREQEINGMRDNWGYDMEPFCRSVEGKPFEYRTSRGYTLRGEIIPARSDVRFADGRQRAVILSHGYTAHRTKMMAFGEVYYRLGFSLVLYDQRYHGDSDKVFCSMGYYESMDAVEIAEYARTQFPENTVWGLQGESMGAATVIMAAPRLPWLSFVCEDCGYCSFKQEVADTLKFKKLPAHPVTELACLLFIILKGISPKKVRPLDAAAEITAPMLFVHGGQDLFVPTENVHKLFAAKPGDNKLKVVYDDVPHAKSIAVHHEEYAALVKSFLTEYGLV